MTAAEKKAFRKKLLEAQGGNCALCGRPAFCSACHYGMEHNDKCRVQAVNTLDHNHKCCPRGEWCEKCARGMTHRICNRFLAILEINPHLQNDFIKAYLSIGER